MKKIRLFFNKITKKYKLVFLSAESLEERFSFFTSRLYFLYVFLCLFIISGGIFFLLFFFTPIKGYLFPNEQKECPVSKEEVLVLGEGIIDLERKLKHYDQFVASLVSVAQNKAPDALPVDSIAFVPMPLDLSTQNSELISEFMDLVKFEEDVLNSEVFFVPTKGSVTEVFNVDLNHFGIDIATDTLKNIHAVLDGVVFMVGENKNVGNFLIINHHKGLMSLYMHAAVFNKQIGDTVLFGEVIGSTGSTGKLSTGNHLHFELIHNGVYVDPAKYINF